MAEVQEPQSTQNQQESSGSDSISRLKKDLEGYREIILPLNKVLEWEQNYYPAVLVGAITFIFAIVWYLELSVLTSFSMLGVIICMVDFAVPTLGSYLFSGAEWTVVQERQFENICIHLLNVRTQINNVRIVLINLKNGKPKVYLLVMMGAFAVLTWIGSLIDNLLLTYMMVVFVACVPVLRKHGILQKLAAQAKEMVGKVIKKAPKPDTTKTN